MGAAAARLSLHYAALQNRLADAAGRVQVGSMSFTFAIGDIHGCHEQLLEMLETVESAWSGGKIVFLGDYVDRGPDSKAVVEHLMAGPTKRGWEWVALKGNHEAMMVTAVKFGDHVAGWLENGGVETIDSYDGQIADMAIDWMESLPVILYDQHRIFVHAGVDESRPLERQTERTLLWSRPVKGYAGDYWGRHVCHGHTPAAENPITVGNRTNIDSGCVFGGSLTAAMFDDDQPGPPIRFINIANRSAV
jgi:serine/threonine protein phosphatase 1